MTVTTPNPRYADPKTGFKARDLVTGTQPGSGKLHVVDLGWRPRPEMETYDDGSPLDRTHLWSGNALCGANNRYLWSPRPERMADDRCVRCFQRLRATGGKLVNAPVLKPVDDIVLPLGWREVKVEGIKTDMEPQDGAVKRKEVRRWVRGDRYVRICEAIYEHETPDERKVTHYLHIGWIGSPSTDRWRYGSDLSSLVQTARSYMVWGGNSKGG